MKKRILLIIPIVVLLIIVSVILIKVFKPIELSTSEYLIEYESPYNDLYFKRGYYVENSDFAVKYVIAMGTQPSGGYSIKIKDVKIDEENNVTVIVKEHSPSR